MFASAGFDAEKDIAGLILNRWGHAYLSPQPGFFFGKDGKPAAREVLRKAPFGRIAFANTDLAGAMDHRFSILEAERAVSFWRRYVLAHEFDTPSGWELQNLLTIARLMIWAALQREESRGVHFRSDFPQRDDPHWQHHLSCPAVL